MLTTSKLPLGLLYALSLIALYIFSFFSLGVSLVWHSQLPTDIWGWLGLMVSSVAYLILGMIGLICTLILSVWIALKDKNMVITIQKTWPLMAAILYAIFPDFIPGPIDDLMILVFGAIASILRSKAQTYNRKTTQARPMYKSQTQDAEYEILDSDGK